DNWLSVRSVNACQACHDSNVWFSSADGVAVEVGGRSGQPTLVNGADKVLPFYTEKYSGVGFKWMGKKLSRNNDAGWVHNVNTPDSSGFQSRFTCGSGGGCH